MRTLIRLPAVGLAVLALSACAADTVLDTPSGVEDVAQTITPGPLTLAVQVCKIALDVNDGVLGRSFTFNTSATGGSVITPQSVVAQDLNQLNPSLCKPVWFREQTSFDDETRITVTEVVPAGFKLKQISFTGTDNYPVPATILDPVSPSVTFVPLDGLTVYFKNVKVDDPPSGQGCTPGYWKQPHHFDSWVGYTPTQTFSSVFGVGPTITLAAALGLNGGGDKALSRHAVAALLNAAHPSISYPLTQAEIISQVAAALGTRGAEALKNRLDVANNAGCPLN